MFYKPNNFQPTLSFYDDNLNKTFNLKEIKKELNYLIDSLYTEKKQLVFLFCKNDYQTIVYYISLLNANKTVFLLDSKLNNDLKNNLISTYKPEVICNSNDFDSTDYFLKNEDKNHWERKNNLSTFELHKDLAVILSTSGTTGSPKGVRLSYENLQSNAENIASYLSINENDISITSLPIHYSYGLSVLNSHLYRNSSMVLSEHSVVSGYFWKILKEHNVSSFAGVPITFDILKAVGFEKNTFPKLKYVTQAGGKLAEEKIKWFYELSLKKNMKFHVMYGQTEATARISYVPFEKLGEKIGSIGVAIPNGNLTLFDNEIEVTAPFKNGELVYSGKNVMLGYSEKREDLSKGNEYKYILRTGDLGYFDNDGFYYISGRLKRFIKIFGLRINLDELEKSLEMTLDTSFACIGEDDNLIVFTTKKDSDYIIKTFLNTRYGINNKAIKINFIEEIPFNTSSKKNYELLKKYNL